MKEKLLSLKAEAEKELLFAKAKAEAKIELADRLLADLTVEEVVETEQTFTDFEEQSEQENLETI